MKNDHNQHTITVNLIIKSDDSETAKRLCEDKLHSLLHSWFVEEGSPPFRENTLLGYNFSSQEDREGWRMAREEAEKLREELERRSREAHRVAWRLHTWPNGDSVTYGLYHLPHNKITPYVVWIDNEDGTHYLGHYFDNILEAAEDLRTRGTR